MAVAGQPIEAVLTLNAQSFHSQLSEATKGVNAFVNSISKSTGQISGFRTAVDGLLSTLSTTNVEFGKFEAQAKGIQSFNQFANGVKALAGAIQTLGGDTATASVGIARIIEIVEAMGGAFGTAEVKVTGLVSALRQLKGVEDQSASSGERLKSTYDQLQQELREMQQGLYRYGTVMSDTEAKAIYSAKQMKAQYKETQAQIKLMSAEFEKAKADLMSFANTGVQAFNKIDTSMNVVKAQAGSLFAEFLQLANGVKAFNSVATQHDMDLKKIVSSDERVKRLKQQVAQATNQETTSLQRQSSALTQSTARTNQLTTATSRLGKAMSSLRMMGSLVGSMLAYNFAHKLLVATGETIHAKSEMEGYFNMLHFGQGEIDKFNSALDQTVQRFQRVNKYSLGETISSIGVEFNLTTDEMIKAMDVTSMITSEYLRAGRNANEASLAVKDVLQGQFQRLSRETGVKGEQLKEAGWNGDVTDVNSLLDALRKVGEDRNWDVFAEKANSLNDILTIIQNRFGEWSADMVNVVQPSIVNAFNAIMSVAGGLSNILGGLWDWLNTDGWGQTAVKIGAIGTALLTVSQMLVMYRTGMGLAQASQLGFTKTLASVVLGLKGQEIAEIGVRNAILSKIMGVRAGTLAEKGMTMAIQESILQRKLETIEEKINSASKGENTVASKLNAVQQQLNKAETEGLIIAKEKDTLQEELNTASKELNTLASIEQTGANTGLLASLYALGTGEALVTAETTALSTAWGVLNGIFMLSPLGWITAGILAVAGAVYVLTGGLDSLWGSLQNATKAVDDAQSAMQPYKDYVNQTNTELEEAKQKYGENSLIVQELSKKYDTAKGSMESYYEQLQKTTNQHSKLNDELGVTSAKMDAIMREKFGDMGYDQSQIDAMTTGISDLDRLRDHDYVALQKHNKMLGDFGSNIEGFAKIAGDDTEAVQNFAKTYSDFVNYADKANTADNWWDWATNSVMAGVSKRSMNFQELMKGDWSKFYSDEFRNFRESLVGDWTLQGSISDLGNQLSSGLNGLGDAWNNFWAEHDWIGAMNDAWSGFSDWVQQSVGTLGDRIMECINNIASYDYIGEFLKAWGLEDFDLGKALSDFFKPLTDLFSGDGFGTMMKIDTTWISNIALGIVDAIRNFDWMGALSGLADTFGISNLVSAIFGVVEGMDITWAWEWLNNNIVTPLQTQFNMFLADPLSFIGGVMTTGMGGLINALIPDDGGVSILNYVNTSIIQPFTQGIQTGIASIPILGDIAQMLGLVPQQNENARQTGYNLLDHLKQGVEQKIREIPIIGDIAQMLGLIPQQNGNAHDKGHGIGENIKEGEKAGHQGIADNVRSEMNNVISAISQKAGEAYAVAHDIGSQILNGIKNALDMHSPSIISRELIANEFGVYIPQAISNAGDVAYQTAYEYGSQIKDGISAVNTDVGLGGMVQTYESDAQMVATSSQLMGTTTTTAFNDMSMAVNSTTSQMGTNVASTYTSMQTKQSTALNSMKQKNLTAYNDMYTKSNQSLIQMRDSTSNITHQMTNAWDHMKNQIVASANRLKHDSTVHFNSLSTTIGGFYRKIQNPSSWGGSPHGGSTHRNVTAGRRIASSFTGGRKYSGGRGSTYTGDKTMTIAQLKKKICPNGDCDGIFDGWASTDVVDVRKFLSMVETGGFGSWGDWNGTHYNHIKNKSDQWSMKSPTIKLKGGIPTNANYKVGDFENGSPKISFASFQSMAESIFSAIPYRFYYNSDWKGSWLGALQAGACNCWDGAHALIAFAQSCGFSGGITHGTWVDPDGTTYPHVWATINGKKMDTTAWQQRGSWSAGSPNVGARSSSNNSQPSKIEVTVNFNEPVYGVDDLNKQIEEGIDKGLQKHFNDPYTIAI